jgi:alpha-glucosidase
MFTFIMKDQSLRSEKRKVVASRSNVRLTDGSSTYNIPANYDLAHELREFCRNRRGADDVMLVGECFGSLDQVARYSVGGNGLTHAFSFDILAFRFDAEWFKDRIDDFEREFPFPSEPAYVFENHDRTRLTDRVHGDLRKARLLATLLLTVRGQPTIYQGQELGMTNTYIPIKEGQDPIAQQFRWLPEVVNKRMPERINRDEVRTPMQWDSSPTAGFCSADVAPWLPINPDHTNRNVDAQHGNPASMLTLYKQLLSMRRAHRALQSGRLDFVAGAPENVVAFRRSAGVDSPEFTVLANFGESAVRMVLSGLSIELATGPGVGFDNGSLLIPGCTAVVLRSQPSPA